jgi:hypothetical protein
LFGIALENLTLPEFTSSFLVLVAAATKWTDDIFSVQLLDYLTSLTTSGQFMDIIFIARLLHGRACPRARRPMENTPGIATFLIGNDFPSLVTVVGECRRTDSFFLHVRDSRGRFVWEVADVVQERQYSVQPQVPNLPPPPVVESADDMPIDPGYSEPVKYPAHWHNLAPSSPASEHLRHKGIDFFIDSGLFLSASRIDDSGAILDGFDAIPDVSVVGIPVFHLTPDGESGTITPLFRRFFGLLGEKNANGNAVVHLGLITFEHARCPIGETESEIGVLFSESPLKLNLKHRSLPKCDLIFFVSPLDEKLYRIRCKCKNTSFWCNILEERIIERTSMLWTITMATFHYVALFRQELLFCQDEKRLQFLREIPRRKMSPFDVIRAFTART